MNYGFTDNSVSSNEQETKNEDKSESVEDKSALKRKAPPEPSKWPSLG